MSWQPAVCASLSELRLELYSACWSCSAQKSLSPSTDVLLSYSSFVKIMKALLNSCLKFELQKGVKNVHAIISDIVDDMKESSYLPLHSFPV